MLIEAGILLAAYNVANHKKPVCPDKVRPEASVIVPETIMGNTSLKGRLSICLGKIGELG